MSKPASEKRQIVNLRRELAAMTRRAEEYRQDAHRDRGRAVKAEHEAVEWKLRFDLLSNRVPK